MNEIDFKDRLNAELSDVTWSVRNSNAVRQQVNREGNKSRKHSIALVLSITVLFAFAATALAAATIEPVNAWLYRIWPEAALKLMPVNLTSDDHGIRMEVISAYARDSEVYVCFSMEDLEGDRINDLTLVFPEAKNGDMTKNIDKQYGNYDRDHGKYLFGTEYAFPASADHDVLTVSVNMVETGEHHLADLSQFFRESGDNIKTMPVPKKTTILGPYRDTGLPETIRVIDSSAGPEIPLCDSVYLSGIGMIDGQLHIQIHYDDCRCQRIDHEIGYSTYDPYHAWIIVKDDGGNLLYTGDMGPDALSILRWGYSYSGRSMYEWEEYFFEVDPGKLETASITVDIRKMNIIEGHWEIDIPLRLISN